MVKVSIPPFNLFRWIETHKDRLKPPVGAELVFEEGEFIIMVVGGPNRRSDYHINMTNEFFYQLKGDMILKIDEDGELKDLPIKEGEVFLLPVCLPHSPQRFPDTIGLVIEHKRAQEQIDRLRWYCDGCHKILHEDAFHVDTLNLGAALKPVIESFYASEEKRTCKSCGVISVPPPQPK
eukprot:TRINITY_DN2084_c0_g1_i2.p1 TRINITY_DN2084_c0_g1~~TRINITY_DN2084_c0_g1_i2.p1  ORF type:complete len:207 (+),score=44.94 TRINITY_DN2084_c0_g1_i2:85-621(+)